MYSYVYSLNEAMPLRLIRHRLSYKNYTIRHKKLVFSNCWWESPIDSQTT